MLVATAEGVAGHHVHQTLGQCFGVVVRSRGLGGNIMAGLRSIVGGEPGSDMAVQVSSA